jgi:hemoglobin
MAHDEPREIAWPEVHANPWVCAAAGGPFAYTATRAGRTTLGLAEAHRDVKSSPVEFDEVAAELGRALDFVKVAPGEKNEILAAFAAHKNDVTEGYMTAAESTLAATHA